MCLVNCPFGAIADKSQIFQVIRAIQSGERVYAAVAPAFVGQFGPKVTPGKLRAAMKQLGFADVFEVAIGADLCAVQEAEDFSGEGARGAALHGHLLLPCLGCHGQKDSSPITLNCVSMALTPMTLTARLIKHEHPDGRRWCLSDPAPPRSWRPCDPTVRSEVDFVLTFEEMAGIFDGPGTSTWTPSEGPSGTASTTPPPMAGDFAVSGGVAKAVMDVIHEKCPERTIQVTCAEGLKDCRKLMAIATKTGKYNGFLLEGMGCPGGCVAGAGTIQPIVKSQSSVKGYAAKAGHKTADQTEYVEELEHLVDLSTQDTEESARP